MTTYMIDQGINDNEGWKPEFGAFQIKKISFYKFGRLDMFSMTMDEFISSCEEIQRWHGLVPIGRSRDKMYMIFG